jgi:pyruvate dehydrogenase E1 component alpha subunit
MDVLKLGLKYDPIERLRVHLANEGIVDDSFLEGLQQESETLGELVRAGVRSMPDPEPGAMFDHVYAEWHPEIEAQRDEVDAYLASFVEEGVR